MKTEMHPVIRPKGQVNLYMSTDVGILIVRLALAIIFIAHGSQKVFGAFGGSGLDGTLRFMGSLGVPAHLAYVAAFTEFIGGIALLVGVLSRVAALGLIINMSVAIAKVHGPNGFFLGPKMGYEYNLALIAMAALVLVAGPGRMALADWEGRWLGRRAIHE